VADGTRPETVAQALDIRTTVTGALGAIPSVMAFNKHDLADVWQLSGADEQAVRREGLHPINTSAKTGEGVEATFQWLARATLHPEKGTA
jgi:50S ribosomal subunit-associated GTPase HflX